MGLSCSPPGRTEVLVVGHTDQILYAMVEMLSRRGLAVTVCEPERSAPLVYELGPDLLLIAQNSLEAAGEIIDSARTIGIPMALLASQSPLTAELEARRIGASAVIPYSPSVEALTSSVQALVEQRRKRTGFLPTGRVELNLRELLDAVLAELRLNMRGRIDPDLSPSDCRLRLNNLSSVASSIRDFVMAVRNESDGIVQVDDAATSTLTASALMSPFSSEATGVAASPRAAGALENIRLLLVDDHISRADSIAQALRGAGAFVAVLPTKATHQDLQRVRGLDPQAVVIGEAFAPKSEAFVAGLRRDTRLRWASMVVAKFDGVWRPETGVHDLAPLVRALRVSADHDSTFPCRLAAGQSFPIELETIGGPRLARALTLCPHPVRVTIVADEFLLRFEIANGLVAGASVQLIDGRKLEGLPALAVLMSARTGTAHLRTTTEPTLANVLMPVDLALELADQETPPLSPETVAEGAALAYRLEGGSEHPPPFTLLARSSQGLAGRKFSVRSIVTSAKRIAYQVATEGVRGLRVLRGMRWPRHLVWYVVAGAALLSVAVLALASGGEKDVVVAEVSSAKAEEPSSEASEASAASEASVASGSEAAGSEAGSEGSGARLGGGKDDPPRELLCGGLPDKKDGDTREAYRLTSEAEDHLNLGSPEETERLLCSALAAEPSYVRAYKNLAVLYVHTDRLELAAQAIQRALDIDPRSETLNLLRADVEAARGDIDQAFATLRATLNVSGGDLKKRRDWGHHFASQASQAERHGIHPRAARLYRRAFVLDPRSKYAMQAAGALLEAGLSQSAEVWAGRAVELAPEDADARALLDQVRAAR